MIYVREAPNAPDCTHSPDLISENTFYRHKRELMAVRIGEFCGTEVAMHSTAVCSRLSTAPANFCAALNDFCVF
jgi:hypothetical protein